MAALRALVAMVAALVAIVCIPFAIASSLAATAQPLVRAILTNTAVRYVP